MEGDLTCNFRKCRKRLNQYAWVTSCSHIFCDEDGTREFKQSYTCPACETALSGKYGIIRIDLQPSEQYKSSHQERTYQEYMATKAKERATQIEQYYEQIVSRIQTELSSLKSQLTASKKDVEDTKKKYNEISEKLLERNRQFQKLQSMYDTLRRKCITPSTFDSSGECNHPSTTKMRNNFNMTLISGEDVLQRHGPAVPPRRHSPPEREFVLHPKTTPIVGNHSGGHEENKDVQDKFTFDIGTPHGHK